MFVDRRRRGEDPWLPFKIGAFVLGAILALAGIATNQRWLIPCAIVVLVIGYGFRFLDRIQGVDSEAAEYDAEYDGDEWEASGSEPTEEKGAVDASDSTEEAERA